MLKIHVKLLSKVALVALRDMEVGMVYKGNKGLPKIIVHKTKRSLVVRNLNDEKTFTFAIFRKKSKMGIKPLKVFAIVKNDRSDIEKLVNKTQTV